MTTGYMCYSAPVTLAATGRDRSHVNVALKLCLDVAKCWYSPDTPRTVRIQGNYSAQWGEEAPRQCGSLVAGCCLLLSLNVWCPLPWWIIAVPLCPGALPTHVGGV